MVAGNQLSIPAASPVFADSWKGMRKTLVVFYRYGESKVYQRTVFQGETMKIKLEDEHVGHDMLPHEPDKLQVLSAVYGAKDVTEKVAHIVDQGKHEIKVNDRALGDRKTLVVLYKDQEGVLKIKVAKEHHKMHLKH